MLPLGQHLVQPSELQASPIADFSLVNAGEELFTCYKASTSACSESDLEDRLIRWGFPLPQPPASQGEPRISRDDRVSRITTPGMHAELGHMLKVGLHAQAMEQMYRRWRTACMTQMCIT